MGGIVRTVVTLAAMLCPCVGILSAEPADEAIRFRLERVGPATSVLVVGSWNVDGISGWSWGICHDPGQIVISDCSGETRLTDPCNVADCTAVACPLDMVEPGPEGQVPSFHVVNLYQAGITQGVLLDAGATWTLPARDRFEMLRVSYVLTGSAAQLQFCDTLGTPPVRTVVGIEGRPEPVTPVTEGVTLRREQFIRGNADGQGDLGIGDAIFILSFMFQNGVTPPCMDAADTNDNGLVDIGDAIGILSYLFAQGAPPAAPSTACGSDPTPDDLTCEFFAPCMR